MLHHICSTDGTFDMPTHCYTIKKILVSSLKYGLRINKHSTFVNELVMLDFEIYKYNTQKNSLKVHINYVCTM